MGNLIPQLRADKTGKLVTRHVRADENQNDNRKRIPKPALNKGKAASGGGVSDMDTPFTLGPFPWKTFDPVIKALEQKYGSSEKGVEITSTQWFAARRMGLVDRRIHAFMLAGIHDPEEMLRQAQKHDNSLDPKVRPGIHDKRRAWVDSLVAAGITHEQYEKANNNFGPYDIVGVLEDFDRKASPADTIRMFADYSNEKTREVINDFIYDGKITLDQLKAIGVTRVRKYRQVIRSYISSNPDFDPEVMGEVIKHEEKNASILIDNVESQIGLRLDAINRWGREVGMSLREPGALLLAGYTAAATKKEMGDEESLAFAKHHDDVLHLSILRGSHNRVSEGSTDTAPLTKISEYLHISDTSFYNPVPSETLEYLRAGLTPEETIKALEDGISAQSARGIKEGITPAVAEGWI